MNLLRKIWTNDDGQDVVEYALVAGVVALVLGTGLATFKTKLSTIWSSIDSALTAST